MPGNVLDSVGGQMNPWIRMAGFYEATSCPSSNSAWNPKSPLGPPTHSAKCRFQIVKICIFLEEFDPLRQLSLAGGGVA
jgi:hypothetical protein